MSTLTWYMTELVLNASHTTVLLCQVWCVSVKAGMREGRNALFGDHAILAWCWSIQKNMSSVPSWLDPLGKRWLVAVECVREGKRWVAFSFCRTLEERSDYCKGNVQYLAGYKGKAHCTFRNDANTALKTCSVWQRFFSWVFCAYSWQSELIQR